MALFVVVCGCRVAASPALGDGSLPRGDGLPDRVIVDGALFTDLSSGIGITDAVRLGDGQVDGSGNGADVSGGGAIVDGAGSDVAAEGGGGAPCGLLAASSCVGDERCYPFPFEGPSPLDVRCAFQGVGGPSVPCQSQLECDGLTLCAAPGQPDSVCLQRCGLENPRCPTGFVCAAFFGYAGVGVCQQP